ncbi:Methyltransferase type 11 [[Leptolyngbya] sp. PCC 7376]|uniref:class I SAM-dependent DNA methyltransferase n=1 Tax=[Leptolyngbya] sp. PCC 7376 TaxID=111781 RepID=UPI00029F3501|nr:class I SAM-dependent methyltransferase [[Leptolyngbya] sp. PCC 7376]AFY38164.1 Methyltransferase type 11 [[Leptolyngbya] sp. PCC 7376]
MKDQQKKQNFTQNLRQSLSTKGSYDSWAATYDEGVQSANYQAPELLASTALSLIDKGAYLDIGCGTGLVGEAIFLRHHGELEIDGCDFSEEMLKIAESKGIYKSLVCCDVFDMPYSNSKYDVVIAAGVFAGDEDYRRAGDPNSQALGDVIRIIKPMGYCIFSVSERVWKTDSKSYERAIADLPVRIIQMLKQPYHNEIPTMFNIVLQKNSF